MFLQVIINSFSGFGPYCFSFEDKEPCTIYDLKVKLAQTTKFSIEEQRIRSLGGRILTDSIDLLKDYSKEGPIILNLTVSLIGGRNKTLCPSIHQTAEPNQMSSYQRVKRSKLNNGTSILRHHSIQQHTLKGKEKESRKRKNDSENI